MQNSKVKDLKRLQQVEVRRQAEKEREYHRAERDRDQKKAAKKS